MADMATKVEAFRVDSKIVHFGIPARVNDEAGAPLYRIACQGRNIRFYVRAASDQSQPVTCQRCGGKARETGV